MGAAATIVAVQKAECVVSVESDRKFLTMVAEHAAPLARAQFHPIYVDIGWTMAWGDPVIQFLTPARVARWSAYPGTPWKLLEQASRVPDLILIDGRFRVACALESILRLPAGSSCRLLFDDFLKRDYYRPVLEFADDLEAHGRMASFRPSRRLERDRCREVLEAHYRDYR